MRPAPASLGLTLALTARIAIAFLALIVVPQAAAQMQKPVSRTPPNILYFILDDVGIDQMRLFGYGGATPPRLPNIEMIANAGVAFRNVWGMPECSPSRALMFEGRYPLRTNVLDAILSVDLANSQVSPYETTTPKVLRRARYESGLFGKFHLSGSNVNPANNPLGYTAVHQLGWDYFAGWQDGAPHAIDQTAGGIAPDNAYACGFVPNTTDNPTRGADTGACYLADQSCSAITRSAETPTPGRACLDRGGIFNPNATCQATVPAQIDFKLQNGYYAGELIINRPDGSYTVYPPEHATGASRGYRSLLESDHAIKWIKSRRPHARWMATVSYSSAHTPYQQPPTALLPAASVPSGGFDCIASEPDQRVLSNQMIEAMDAQIGRVLVETGVATRKADGSIEYDPDKSNTMIVIMGDNGTYAPVVKAPFNPLRAKATVYQTGVWVPLLVAGPLVRLPGRQVTSMVNIADVFQLFGEIAGINVHDVVPWSRPIDSVAMLPYLTNPEQPSLRKSNFTQLATNLKAAGTVIPPCVIASANTCVQLFPQQQLCESEGGVWWGSGGTVTGAPQKDCCGVNKYLLTLPTPLPAVSVLADSQQAMRNADYKLVRSTTTDYDMTTNACATATTTELYKVSEDVPPKLDDADSNLLLHPTLLDKRDLHAFAELSVELRRLLRSNVVCQGDGNQDGVVDYADVEQFNHWANVTGMQSSWYDFNLDGLTNQLDVPYIADGRFPRPCPRVRR